MANFTVTVTPPAGSKRLQVRCSTQDVFPGTWVPGNVADGISAQTRLNNLGPPNMRFHAGTDSTIYALPFPNISLPFTTVGGITILAGSGAGHAYDFTNLNGLLQDAAFFGDSGKPDAQRLMLNIRYFPDVLYTNLGAAFSSQGYFADPTFAQAATYFANVIAYYNSFFTTTLSQQISSGANVTSLPVTALVGVVQTGAQVTIGSQVFTVASPGAQSGATSIPVVAQLAAATYASGTTVTNTNPLAGTGSVVPTPWPRPAGPWPIRHLEIYNEPDFSSENPRVAPAIPPPAAADITLTGLTVGGGVLTPATYSYRCTSLDSVNDESAGGTNKTIVLGGTNNAIGITLASKSNLGKTASAYRIYGRTSGAEQLLVVVGDQGGRTWTDNGTITPSGAIPGTDSTPGGSTMSPLEYLSMWNVIQPAVKAVDSTLKCIGPCPVFTVSLVAGSVIKTTVATTGPNDTSFLDTRDFYQVLMTSVNTPDAVSFHSYGGSGGSGDSDQAMINQLLTSASQFGSNILPYTGTVPIWWTEANSNAAPYGTANDFRGNNAYCVACFGMAIAQFAPQVANGQPRLATIDHYEVADVASATDTFAIIPLDSAVTGSAPGRPLLLYWLFYWFNQLFPANSTIIDSVSGNPAGIDVLAVITPDNKLRVMVVNRQVAVPATDHNGPGVNNNATVSVTAGGWMANRLFVIDSSLQTATGLRDGPAIQDLAPSSSTIFAMNGYSVALVEFAAPAVVTPGVPSTNAQGWRR